MADWLELRFAATLYLEMTTWLREAPLERLQNLQPLLAKLRLTYFMPAALKMSA